MAQVKEQGLVSFLARSEPKIPFLGLSLLRNQTETLATQDISVWAKTMAIIIYNVYYMFRACLSQK